ncbi:MAG: hypothetical protein U5K31_03560 [Balneolaceae bacterium]|nr:hypothetical protein [Balneolaceae bacterium]
MKRITYLIFILAAVLAAPPAVFSQSADDVLRYQLQYPSQDAISLVMPGTAWASGYGAYQQNPASMALFDESYLSFSLDSRYVSEEGRYLGSSNTHDVNETNIGDFGFLYDFPVSQGALVVGGGYSQSADFNRALAGGGFNNRSSITDFYNIAPDDSLFFAAFDVYAIDYATTDSSFANTSSIFRIGVPYKGVDQDFEMQENGRMGEYSAFIATEFKENLLVGASIGIFEGGYTYERNFLESDRQDLYNYTFIDTDGDGEPETDIDRILSEDTIDASFTAFSARLGAIYRITPHVQVGVGYQFPSTLSFEEEYNTTIRTTFDNGVVFEDEAPGRFNYKIVRPNRINLGVGAQNLGPVNLSASAEYVPYSEGRIEFDELELRPSQEAINDNVGSSLSDVWNLQAGLEFEVDERFVPRLGYAHYPSPYKGTAAVDNTRQIYSGGSAPCAADRDSLRPGRAVRHLGRPKQPLLLCPGHQRHLP